jgi:hypothetical protein
MGAAQKNDEDRRGAPDEAAVRARLRALYGDQLGGRDPKATQRIGRAPTATRPRVEPARLAAPVAPAREAEAAVAVADQPPQTAGFLCLRPLPPLPLANGLALTVGRAPECHLMLPDSEVSRRHCTVTVQDGKVSVLDLGSINGTLVNERRAQRADVRHGDVVTVGPYHLELLGEEAAQAWEAECAASAGAPEAEHAMSGRLGQVPLSEVLQQIEFNERTGTLEVACGRRRGSVVIDDGRPRSATFGKLTDGPAVLALLRLREGRFSFVRTRDLGACTMHQTFTALLLEASRRVDEGAPDEDPGEADAGPMPAPAAGVRSPRLSLSLASALESIPEAVPVDLPVEAPVGADEPKTMALRQAPLLARLRAAAGQRPAGEATRLRAQRPRPQPAPSEPRPYVRSYSPTGIERQAMPAAQLPDQIRQIVARLEERTRENDPKPALAPVEAPATTRVRPHPAWILTGAMAIACVGFAGRPTAFRSAQAGAPGLGDVGADSLAESPVESSRRPTRPEASTVAGAWSIPTALPWCAPTPVETLEMARARHCAAAWTVALAGVETALEDGDSQAALRQLGEVDPGKLGPAPATARAVGARCMHQAAELAACRPRESTALTHLRSLLQLGRRLEAGSAPAESVAPLLAALDAPGASSDQLCLALIEVTGAKAVRRRVLLQAYRAMEGRSSAPLGLLLAAAGDSGASRAELSPERLELLDFARSADVRAELHAARGIARAELGRLVEALRDVEQALTLGCDDAALHDLRDRLADAVGRSATLRARRVG